MMEGATPDKPSQVGVKYAYEYLQYFSLFDSLLRIYENRSVIQSKTHLTLTSTEIYSLNTCWVHFKKKNRKFSKIDWGNAPPLTFPHARADTTSAPVLAVVSCEAITNMRQLGTLEVSIK